MKMSKVSFGLIAACLIFMVCLGNISCAKKTIKPNITAEELYKRLVNNPALKKYPNGESFCWQARVGMGQFSDLYEVTKDVSWIDYGIKYCDFLLDKMDTGPDGYKGWIGPYIYDRNYWCDVHVGDAILLCEILDIASVVLEDASLKKVYEDKVTGYVEIAKIHLIEKWDKRDTWKEDGSYGAYVSYGRYLEPGNLKEWKYGDEVRGSQLTLPFNKQNDVAQVCLLIYRITGEKFYRNKAEKLFLNMKRRFQYFDDHYVWNYWEPFGIWDIDMEKKDTRHWVGVHPYRSGYTAGEVHQIVDAYHMGLVFDEQDIQRIINTNLEVMWNKDKVNPEFINSNGQGADKDTSGLGAFRKAHGHSNAIKNAGQLWTGLLDFNQTIRDLYELRFKKDDTMSNARLYYENIVRRNRPSFKRKYVKGKVTFPAVDFTECRDLNMAAVMPHIITRGKESIIVTKSLKSGELEIALYSKDGNNKIKSLHKENIGSRVFFITWDGIDPDKKKTYKGDYRIRWSFGDGYREFSITIK